MLPLLLPLLVQKIDLLLLPLLLVSALANTQSQTTTSSWRLGPTLHLLASSKYPENKYIQIRTQTGL